MEIASPSDDLATLMSKMQEYIDNGASLGWLIDRSSRRVYVYAPNQDMEILDNPTKVNGDPFLVGFSLDLTKIW